MATFDTIIRGGRVVDGTGSPAFYADVGIRDGRIAAVGHLSESDARQVIDATGKIVAPGHVSYHAHYDVQLFWDPYCSSAGENGTTTILNANCGFSVAPVRGKDVERTMRMLSTTEQIPVSHQRAALPWDWESFPEYLARVEQLPKGVNILSYLPLNPLLVYVMGLEAAKTRRPTADEMAEMRRLINEAMDAGAVGVSMSAMGAEGNSHLDCDGTPMPTDVADHETILEIGRCVAKRGEGLIQLLSHVIVYGDRTLSERMAEMAKGSGARVFHHSFLTSDMMPEAVNIEDLAWLDALRARGCDVTVSCAMNRGWVEAGLRELDTAAGQLAAVRRIIACESDEAVLELIADREFRKAFADEYADKGAINGGNALEAQTIVTVGDAPELQAYLGRTLGEVAVAEGCGVVEALLDLGRRSRLALQLKSPQITSTDPHRAVRMMAHSAVIPGNSDGGAHTKTLDMAHYPTDFLVWLVREEGLVTLEAMHFQLALKSARAVQIFDRGALLPGYWADVLVYDLDELFVDLSKYQIVHDMPLGDWRRKSRSGGYDYILVNGVVTHERGHPTGASPGRLVRVTTDRRRPLAAAAE